MIKTQKIIEENAEIDNYDTCKKLLDFKNLSHCKDTPNISSASNIKSYARYDSETGTNRESKKFTRHTRGNSIFDTDYVPVKEVCVYDYNYDDPMITNLKSFYEPAQTDKDQVVIEYEDADEDLETSPMELQPSIRLEKSKTKNESPEDKDDSDMSSDIRNDSMIAMFDEGQNYYVQKYMNRPHSKIDTHDLPKTSPSMIELNKFKTFYDYKTNKNTMIEKLPTSNNTKFPLQKSDQLISKFTSHTIECQDKSKGKSSNTQLNRKRSLSKKESIIGVIKRSSVSSNQSKNHSLKVDYKISKNCSPDIETHLATELQGSSYCQDSNTAKTESYLTRRPKVSKPTKTITMNIYDEVYNSQSRNNPLRNSKESASLRGSIISKKTPQNDTDSVKLGGLSTTHPNTLSNSGKAANALSSNNTADKNKSEKMKDRKQNLKDSRSQKCFEKNPIAYGGKYNRLKKIKKKLDKHQSIINEITNIKEEIDKKKQQKIKRSTSRTNRRNTVLNNNLSSRQGQTQNAMIIRSRSKTDFEPAKNKTLAQKTKGLQKTNIYTLSQKN